MPSLTQDGVSSLGLNDVSLLQPFFLSDSALDLFCLALSISHFLPFVYIFKRGREGNEIESE